VKVTTILLIYNEEENVEPQTRQVLDAYRENNIDGEVLLVDDGSTDRSPEICDILAEESDRIRVVHHSPNKGRSMAIRTGFLNAEGEVSIIMDADLQYEAKQIPMFLRKMEEGWDVVSGYRRDRSDKFIRKFISKVYNRIIIRRIFHLDIMDQNSGFKAFRTAKAVEMDFNPEGYLGLHRFILPLAHIKGLSITEVPIVHYHRPAGRSYIKSYTVPFITLRDFFRFRKQYKEELRAVKRRR
jgi:glycosyltransferase involved in cell wall biosynthesis